MPTPRRPEEISPEWLTAVLRDSGALGAGRVAALHQRRLGGVEGFLSRVVRVDLRYEGEASGAPASLIVKLPPAAGAYRDFGDELHAFARELRFYREVAPLAPVRLPRCYGAVHEPPDYALVLEDLSFATAGDQVAGMHAAQVLATARLVGRLQARFWGDAALAQLAWMPASNRVAVDFDAQWPSLEQHFGAAIGPAGLAVGARLRGGGAAWVEAEMARRPPTIVHSDLRADNLLFGPPDGDDAVLIVDWQLAVRSMGAFDIARLTAGSELPRERAGHHLDVVRAWHAALHAGGVADYTQAEALRDFRLGVLALISWPVHFHAGVLGTIGRPRLLADVMCRRIFATAVEIDAASVLP